MKTLSVRPVGYWQVIRLDRGQTRKTWHAELLTPSALEIVRRVPSGIAPPARRFSEACGYPGGAAAPGKTAAMALNAHRLHAVRAGHPMGG